MNFVAGQQVRLISQYRTPCLTHKKVVSFANQLPIVRLVAGEMFKVAVGPRVDRGSRYMATTVLVRNAEGLWCIPARLLEAVTDAAV